VFLAGCGTFEIGIESTHTPGDDNPTITETVDIAPTETSTPAPTATPTPLPSQGLRVAFIADNNVWLWREGGEAVAIASTGEPAGIPDVKLSDDGEIVAFLREGELWAVNSDGSEERRLVGADDLDGMARRSDYQDAGVALYQFDWIPGTHRLAFNTRIQVRIQVPVLNDDLHVVDAETLEQTVLLPPGEGGDFVFAPDGSRAAIVKPGSISVIDQDGGNPQEVFTHTPVVFGENIPHYVSPAWASDGSALRVAVPPTDPSVPSAPTSVWHISMGGTPPILIGSIIASPSSQFLFSPDLSHVMYLDIPGGNFNMSELLITQLENGETTTYYNVAFQLYGWSPDARHFAFVTQNVVDQFLPPQAQIGQLGGDPFPIYETEFAVTNVTWVDETRYLFLVGAPSGWEIYLGELGGTDTYLATIGTATDGLLSENMVPYDFAY
jgi:hypothetical protein